MKKKYIKPAVIDLSIEGITGIGAGICSNGLNISEVTCSVGQGATGSCTFTGLGVSGACASGSFPYEMDTICGVHGLSAASCYSTGSSATQGMSRCMDGLSATHSSTNPHCTLNGAADSNICWSGNANNPTPPSS